MHQQYNLPNRNYSTFQGFTQTVLPMSVFKKRLSFPMRRFMKNDHEIILKCRWGLEVLHAPQLVHDGALVRFQGAKH